MVGTRPILFVWPLIALLAVAPVVLAQGDDSDDLGSDQLTPLAPVTIDGKVLFKLRGVSALPAAERAAGVTARIVEAARDPAFDPKTIEAVAENGMTAIVGGDKRFVAVVEADAHIEGVGRAELAMVLTHRIRKAIEEYRIDRQPEALITAGLKTVAATALLAFLLACLRWLWRWLDRRIGAKFEAGLRSLGVDSVQAGSSQRVGAALRGVVLAVRNAVMIALVLTYLLVVLGLFPWTGPINDRISDWIVQPLMGMGEAIVSQVPNVIFLIILVLVLRWLIGLIRLFFAAVERGAITIGGFEPEWAMPTFKIARMAVIAFGIVVAYPYIPGSNTAAFKGVSIFAGIMFSLGSSSVISNLIAGFMMTYRRAFKLGDRIRIGDVVGEVADIRLQVTHIRTPKNEEVVIPNSLILGSEVVNYTTLAATRGLILPTTVGIGYETPWRQVESMLLMAADRTPNLLSEPAPFVLQKSLGDFAVTYELNVYCDRPDRVPHLLHALHRSILDVFNEYGVQIMTPNYEGDPEHPKMVPREEWFTAPAQDPTHDGSPESG